MARPPEGGAGPSRPDLPDTYNIYNAHNAPLNLNLSQNQEGIMPAIEIANQTFATQKDLHAFLDRIRTLSDHD